MAGTVYILVCVLFALLGRKNNLGFVKVLAIGLLLTPVASCVYVLSKGKISVAAILITLFIVLMIPSVYFIFLSKPLCNNIMKGLDYSSANGTQIVTLDVDAGTYSWEYLPDHLEAKSKEDVGYVLEVRYGTQQAQYTSGIVEGEVIYAKLVDCDTGKVIAENTFKAEFPYSISSDCSKVFVQESEVSDWVDTFFP